MIARDTGRLIVLSAFVALCAIVLFSSETEARGKRAMMFFFQKIRLGMSMESKYNASTCNSSGIYNLKHITLTNFVFSRLTFVVPL